MQPYQEASEEFSKQSSRPFQAAAAIAVPIAKAGIGKRVASFLSKYIPQDLSIKGLSKIDPRLGKFAELSMEAGHSFDEVKDFIGKKISESEAEQSSQPPKEQRNIIEQYSPELHQFISGLIKEGRSPLEAAALSTLDKKGKKFSKIIKKITQDHKSPWSSIVSSVYGSGQTQTPQNSPQIQNQQQQPIGQGQQALMQILQKINQKIGG